MKQDLIKWVVALGLVIGCLASWGCGGSRIPFAGTYRSEAPYADKGYIELDLKENGEATWKLEKEARELKFKWKVEAGRLFLYTREGAVMIATPSEGGKRLTMDMSGNWHPSCPVSQCIIFDKVSGAS
jgi:hypothetical protein